MDKTLHETLTGWRRHLHQHPELSCHEIKTAAFVTSKLAELGIPFETGVGGHGVVATLQRGASNRSVGLRADMDALPIVEETGLAHASTNPGGPYHDYWRAEYVDTGRLIRSFLADNPGIQATEYEATLRDAVTASRLAQLLDGDWESEAHEDASWDAEDIPGKMLFNGHPAGSGMPLVWAHSEYVKLLRSLHDGKVWDMPPQPVDSFTPLSTCVQCLPASVVRYTPRSVESLHNWPTTQASTMLLSSGSIAILPMRSEFGKPMFAQVSPPSVE